MTVTRTRVSAAVLVIPTVVDRGERDRDEQGDRSRMGRPRVRPSGESHRRTARDLADDEGPAGQEPPERTELAAAVDIGAAGLRMDRGQASGGHRVAVRHERGKPERQQDSRACRARGWGERREDPGSEHGAEPDDDRVTEAQPPLQPAVMHRRKARSADA